MKKSVIILLTALFTLSSCEKWLDVNYDPNSPKEVPLEMSFPAAEMIVATRVGGNLYNIGGFFAQYWDQAPEANQYNSLAKYDVQPGLLNYDYSELFAALNNLKVVKEQAKNEKKWGYYIAATALRAYTYQVMIDLFDDIPYSEALTPSINQPKYDAGKSVYSGLIEELQEALSYQSEALDLGTTDLYSSAGNIQQWIGFSQAILLKLYMRQSPKDNTVGNAVKSLLDNAAFFTGDISMGNFTSESGRMNPWYEIQKVGLSADNHCGTICLVQTLSDHGDSRLNQIFVPGSAGHKGVVPGIKGQAVSKNDKTAMFSLPGKLSATRSVYLYSQAELQFFIAEAHLRFNNDNAAAQRAYEKGIAAAYAVWGVTGQPLYPVVSIDHIGKQKWFSLAMINNIEAWIEIRRLGQPRYTAASAAQIYTDPSKYLSGELIDPYVNNLGAGKYLNRLYYPERSTSVNANAPQQKSLTDKMFWQQ